MFINDRDVGSKIKGKETRRADKHTYLGSTLVYRGLRDDTEIKRVEYTGKRVAMAKEDFN